MSEITQETAKEMLEALREMKRVYDEYHQLLPYNVSIALRALEQAENELKA